jgi:ankyrin repeat protein
MASSKGHVKIVQLLLKAGASVNHAVADGFTALEVATVRGHVEVVNILRGAAAALKQEQ